MNNFKKNILKTRTDDIVVPPTPDCFCDTCEPTENCFTITISNTADQTDIGVYYQSAELGQLTPIVPLQALLATDNNNGTTTYFACSTSFVSIYNTQTNEQISWTEGSFSSYSCPTKYEVLKGNVFCNSGTIAINNLSPHILYSSSSTLSSGVSVFDDINLTTPTVITGFTTSGKIYEVTSGMIDVVYTVGSPC